MNKENKDQILLMKKLTYNYKYKPTGYIKKNKDDSEVIEVYDIDNNQLIWI